MTARQFPLPTPFKEQMAVEARSIVPSNASCEGATSLELYSPGANTPISIRIDRDRVAFNTRISGTWGQEVTHPYKDVGAPSSTVTIRVQALCDHFYITINDEHFDYKYRCGSSYSDINEGRSAPDTQYYKVSYIGVN